MFIQRRHDVTWFKGYDIDCKVYYITIMHKLCKLYNLHCAAQLHIHYVYKALQCKIQKKLHKYFNVNFK